MATYDVMIIGGGITGLATAYRLTQDAPTLKVAVFESTSKLGGKIETERFGGFVLESGPDCFLSRKPRGIGLCDELGISENLVGRTPLNEGDPRAYVQRHDQLHPLPEGLTGLVPTNLDAFQTTELLSAEAKQRLAEEPSIPPTPSTDDESVASFIGRRLGRETYENLVEPLMSGIYAGDGEKMSILSTFPQLRQVEAKHGSLLAGLTQNTPPPSSSDYPPFVSFENGMGVLIDELVAQMPDVDIYLDSPVSKISRTGNGWDVSIAEDEERFAAPHLVMTTPAFVNAELLRSVDPELADVFSEIPYAGTVLVNISVADDAIDLPAGYGYVIPRAEKRNLLACTWTSQKWDKRVPPGRLLLRVYIGRYGEDDVCSWTDGDLIELARNELKETLGLPEGAKQMYLIVRWPKGLPQYTLGHPERLARIYERLDMHQGLYAAGAAFHGVGIPDCIQSGEEAARAILKYQ